MRELNIGSKKYTKVICLDEPGNGGACHSYAVVGADVVEIEQGKEYKSFAVVAFQDGPIKESGVNGCHQEDLLSVVIDRLQCFQKGEYACRENAIALTKIEEAMMWLRKRTQDRIDRGVEGTRGK